MTKKFVKLDKVVDTFINVVSFFKEHGLVTDYEGTFENYWTDGEVNLKVKLNRKSSEFELNINCNGVKCVVFEYDADVGIPMYTLCVDSNNSYLIDDITWFQINNIAVEVTINEDCYLCDFDLEKIED